MNFNGNSTEPRRENQRSKVAGYFHRTKMADRTICLNWPICAVSNIIGPFGQAKHRLLSSKTVQIENEHFDSVLKIPFCSKVQITPIEENFRPATITYFFPRLSKRAKFASAIPFYRFQNKLERNCRSI